MAELRNNQESAIPDGWATLVEEVLLSTAADMVPYHEA